MIRTLGAIVGAGGKADTFVNSPWQRLGLEFFRIPATGWVHAR